MRFVTATALAASVLTCIVAVAPAAEPLRTTDPGRMSALPGFRIERLYSVPDEQGSWVSMTVDERGRLIVSDQYGSLYRVTVPPVGAPNPTAQVEPLKTPSGSAHGLLYAYNSLYVVQSEKEQGLYRLRDADGDDQFDDSQLIRRIDGGGEHGPHSVVLGPDGKIYIAAGNHTKLTPVESSLVPQNWNEDHLLPRMWDAGGHAVGILAPGGWICRMDPEGKHWELVSMGYRNEFDLSFNPEGELFTYDSDMEWDIGAPWYRPTRVVHATSGSEFGWRSGAGKWPAYYVDSLPPVVNIGPGSPTGTTFGTGTKFPHKYQRAYFINDWSYGIIYAVHMTPDGSSYRGTAERFVSGAPLPATDILIHPDGAMYFAIGGRRAPSGLYRVVYEGTEPTTPAPAVADGQEAARKLRHSLEALHHPGAENAVEVAWPYLDHSDRFIRYAARIAIEHQPVGQWQTRVLQESNPRRLIAGAVALARNGDPSVKDALLERLANVNAAELPLDDKLDLLRAVSLVFIRLGAPTTEQAQYISDHLGPAFPTESESLNREIANLLVYVQSPHTAPKLIAQMKAARTQEEQVHYAYVLRNLTQGWTPELRKEYFGWFPTSRGFRGGHSFAQFLVNIRQEAFDKVPESERAAIEPLFKESIEQNEDIPVEKRDIKHQWSLDELAAVAPDAEHGRNFERGRRMFAVANCFKCHRVGDEGGSVGPDLTGVGRRFDSRYIIEATIDPNKVISDQYKASTFILKDGRTVTGRVANIAGNNIMVMTDMLNPGHFANVEQTDVEETHDSNVSMMPAGLLNTLEKEEVLDLLAYLRSGGNPDSEYFSKQQ